MLEESTRNPRTGTSGVATTLVLVSVCLAAAGVVADADAQADRAAVGSSITWTELDTGLEIAAPRVPPSAVCAETTITVLKIDPESYELALLCASEHGERRRTGREWCREFALTCAINASMYATDDISSTGYMRTSDHINNAFINEAFGAIMAFDRLDERVPLVQIIDRYEQDWESLITKYGTLIQNYRIISTRQRNQWQRQEKMHSTSAVAMDSSGKVLFIFSRAPYSTHEFGNLLLELPLSIHNVMYCEGGPAAFLYSEVGETIIDQVGSYASGFFPTCTNERRYRVPNVIGARRRAND